MAEQEQTQKPETLEQKLMRIGLLNSSRVHIKEAAKANDAEALYQEGTNLAAIIAGGDQRKLNNAYNGIRVSASEATRYANENLEYWTDEANKLYKQEKDNLIKKLISQMNKNLKAAKADKATAGSILAQYFNDMVDIPQLTQAKADNYAREDSARELHISVDYVTTADSIEQYEAKHKNRYLRETAVDYLKENEKDGKVIGYSVDENKLAEELKETGNGNGIRKASAMYTNALRIQEMQKRAKEEAAKESKKAKK